jgi:hypothetical protein
MGLEIVPTTRSLEGIGQDGANAFVFDLPGNPYVTGSTTGSFPTTTDAYQSNFGGGTYDAFVTELNPAGSPPWTPTTRPASCCWNAISTATGRISITTRSDD